MTMLEFLALKTMPSTNDGLLYYLEFGLSVLNGHGQEVPGSE